MNRKQQQKAATTVNKNGRTIATTPAGRQADVSKHPYTGTYKPIPHIWFQHPVDLPPFGFNTIRAMLMDEGIRLNFSTRAAPIYGLQFGWEENGVWKEGVKCKDAAVAQFIYRQLQRIWKTYLPGILRSQIWGWSAGEVCLKLSEDTGLVEINDMLPRHPMDCKLLKRGCERYGIEVARLDGGTINLPFPYAWFSSYGAEDGEDYGVSAAYGAYSPWADKWFDGGAKDVRRLFMHKDAYGGVDIAYPPGETYLDSQANPVPNRDIARQISEQIRTGGSTQRPNEYDENGNPKWEISRATVTSNPQHILDYPKDLDTEIRHGMEIPDDVINSGTTGAWNGKAIPMQSFYSSLDGWATTLLRDLCVQIIDHLLVLNFGKKHEYETPFKSLGKQAMEDQETDKEQSGMPQDSPNFGFSQPNIFQRSNPETSSQQPVKMSLVDQVGSGELTAEAILSESRKAVQDRVSSVMVKLAEALQEEAKTEATEEEKPIEEPKKLGCVMLECPANVIALVNAIQLQIDPYQLRDDGLEDWPHVTLLYGLEGDDVASVEAFVKTLEPVAITMRGISTFEKENGDCVLKIDVDSEVLHEYHSRIKEAFPVEETYPTYRPHVTICYCTKEEAAKFVREFETSENALLEAVCIAMNDTKTFIPLGDRPEDIESVVVLEEKPEDPAEKLIERIGRIIRKIFFRNRSVE